MAGRVGGGAVGRGEAGVSRARGDCVNTDTTFLIYNARYVRRFD